MLRTLGASAPLLLGCYPRLALQGATSPTPAKADDEFLDELQRATFRFFVECAHPDTGLVKDRNRADGPDERPVASIAATGFGLTALCIADERGWLPRGEASARVRTTLKFLFEKLPHEHGFHFHFIDWRTGERVWKCELSSIDSALLFCGVLTCRQHFLDAEIRRLAEAIFARVDWHWMLNGGALLSHGWKPESGFLESRWKHYCEHMMLYLMAIGARQHAIPASAWDAWQRPWFEYAGLRYLTPRDPIFVHQYAHAWIDFRGRRDRHANYFENSVTATKVHRAFCQSLSSRYPHFSEDVWGITASDGKDGYMVWGGPPEFGGVDGTVVPCAAAGSLPFLPAETLRCLRALREKFGERVWCRYGFVDAFNPATGWVGPDVIGINAGITLLMAENLRSDFVWRTFMKNPEITDAMRKVGFREDKAAPAKH